MRTDRELLQAAFDALEAVHHVLTTHNRELIKEIRACLADPEDEPIAWSSADGYVYRSYTVAKHSNNGKEPIPLYRHPPQPMRLSDEEILAIAEKYGTSSTRNRPTYHLHDGSPTGETYPQTDWDIGQEYLLGFARELLEKNQ